LLVDGCDRTSTHDAAAGGAVAAGVVVGVGVVIGVGDAVAIAGALGVVVSMATGVGVGNGGVWAAQPPTRITATIAIDNERLVTIRTIPLASPVAWSPGGGPNPGPLWDAHEYHVWQRGEERCGARR
jgi:hypothetical protein